MLQTTPKIRYQSDKYPHLIPHRTEVLVDVSEPRVAKAKYKGMPIITVKCIIIDKGPYFGRRLSFTYCFVNVPYIPELLPYSAEEIRNFKPFICKAVVFREATPASFGGIMQNRIRLLR